MGELKMTSMERDASNAALRGFGRMVLSVAEDEMADGGKLYADLVLQACHQGDAE